MEAKNGQSLILKETQDWANEFQNSINQIEKDLKLHVEQLKADQDKAAEANALAVIPGSIEATVSNADKTDDFRFDVKLEGQKGLPSDETIASSKTWARIGLNAGQYKLSVSARAAGKPVMGVAVVLVKPGETTKATLALPF